MTDYRRIRLSPRFRKLQTRDTWRFHLQSLQWLERAALDLGPGRNGSFQTEAVNSFTASV